MDRRARTPRAKRTSRFAPMFDDEAWDDIVLVGK
jgi:hypothetical protein